MDALVEIFGEWIQRASESLIPLKPGVSTADIRVAEKDTSSLLRLPKLQESVQEIV